MIINPLENAVQPIAIPTAKNLQQKIWDKFFVLFTGIRADDRLPQGRLVAGNRHAAGAMAAANHAGSRPVPDDDEDWTSVADSLRAAVDSLPVKTAYRNPAQPKCARPPRYPALPGENTVYAIRLKTYIRETVLNEVNPDGRPPLWLRPLAAVASWLGIHGVGQTNCLSCATAVADTLRQGVLHRADPHLRGGSPDEFATFGNVSRTLFDSTGELAGRLGQGGDINAVLTLVRPRWRRLFSPVAGHACNIIKTGDIIHLVDAQKKSYVTVDQTHGQAAIHKALLRFLGPLSADRGAISLGNIGFYPPPAG
ncbi:toxin glutamine deamidase domain-containing protein [Acerihabitans arboris]|uniref:Tox-PL domain-containing protein n=1 Tax=Acerihabitans arboris TaxID=2691583 RepID=A0A845SKN7_9GAMM|nr:toxin glutamine deamidase domain-containing protein [Acerihabitans arboris]NDL61875.1 hypothetical protein [Acerihabitans arboris]